MTCRETSAFSVLPHVQARALKKVPFVELHDGKVQGVVSSGSDMSRVYVCLFSADGQDFSCSTNNNRRCGGLRGSPCKHLMLLMDEAIKQFGFPSVAATMRAEGLSTLDDPAAGTSQELLAALRLTQNVQPAGEIFSRFLAYLQFLELQGAQQPLPEMSWFVTGASA